MYVMAVTAIWGEQDDRLSSRVDAHVCCSIAEMSIWTKMNSVTWAQLLTFWPTNTQNTTKKGVNNVFISSVLWVKEKTLGSKIAED